MSRSNKEKRESPRYPMRWKVSIVYDHVEDHPTFHGVTHELSVSGLSLLTDHNIFTDETITVLLAIPPKHQGARNKVIEARARMAYTVHSAGHDQFRIGLEFKQFKDGARAILETSLKERAVAYSAGGMAA
jgi:hypothetical protein